MQHLLKIFSILAFIFFYGCKGTEDISGITGNMMGYAQTDGDDSLPNMGVLISIDGTNFRTVSQKDGRWDIENVPPGTYNISFTKDGYAMEKIISHSFAGNGTDYLGITEITKILDRKVSFTIRAFSDPATGPSSAVFTCRIFVDDSLYSNIVGEALILFGKLDSLSPLNPNSYSVYVDNINTLTTSPSSTGYNMPIYRNTLLESGFHSGDKIFCQAFVSRLIGWGNIGSQNFLDPSYLDISTNKRIYTGFGNNHSEVKSFILP